MPTHVDICYQCRDSRPLSECTITAHWERRLRDYRLGERRGDRYQPKGREEDQSLMQLSPNDADRMVIGPLVLPSDPELAEVFAMESFGVSYPKEPTRFWPFPGSINRSAYIKTGRMGLSYGQDMPGEKESL